jgi:hypothetical protein
MLEVHDLTKRYAGIPVVDHVSFVIHCGETLGTFRYPCLAAMTPRFRSLPNGTCETSLHSTDTRRLGPGHPVHLLAWHPNFDTEPHPRNLAKLFIGRVARVADS